MSINKTTIARTHLVHPIEQKLALQALSKKTGAPVCELIRRFIDAGLARESKTK